MRLVLLGAPGSGKGTQARMLMGRYSIPEISTGEILRKAVADGTPLGKDAKGFMDRGELAPNSIVLGLVHSLLKRDEYKAGYIINGFPRNETQAVELDRMLAAISAPVSLAVSIDVDAAELFKRMAGRRICTVCRKVYNIHFLPARKEGVCDSCGGVLFQRNDDRDETIRKRLAVYESQRSALSDHYRNKGILKSVVGTGSVQDIFEKVCASIER